MAPQRKSSVGKKAKPLKPIHQCPRCEEVILDKDQKSIGCDRCLQWFHQTCSQLSDTDYDFLHNGKESIVWLCGDCLDKSGKERSKLISLEDTIASQSEKIDSLMELILTMKQDILKEVDAKLLAHGKPTNKPEEEMDKAIDERLEEKREQEKRVNNVIMVNVPEIGEGIADAQAKDKEQVITLLCKANPIQVEDVQDFVRLGKRGQNPRIIKVAFKDKETKHKVITSQKKLNVGVSETRKVIYINQDYTPNQRKLEAQLRDEIKQRRVNGEQDLVIRDLRIIKRHSGSSD